MIQIYNRQSKSYEIEQVAGEGYLKWCYESPIGKGLTELLVKRKLFSKIYGSYCDTKLSKRKIILILICHNLIKLKMNLHLSMTFSIEL